MLPIAVTATAWPRLVANAALAALVCLLVPELATGILGAVLATMGLLALVFAMAHLASRPFSVGAGDWLELEDGARGRVRAVRVWFTVVDTVDGATVLVPNHLVERYRPNQPYGDSSSTPIIPPS